MALLICATGHLAYAQSAKIQPVKSSTRQIININELSHIQVTKYELALVQVMAEMCPKMLDAQQRQRFFEAYHQQLQAFIPNVDNPERILEYLTSQRDYRAILHNVRAWTATFPTRENYEICTQFANVGRAF